MVAVIAFCNVVTVVRIVRTAVTKSVAWNRTYYHLVREVPVVETVVLVSKQNGGAMEQQIVPMAATRLAVEGYSIILQYKQSKRSK